MCPGMWNTLTEHRASCSLLPTPLGEGGTLENVMGHKHHRAGDSHAVERDA